MRRFLTLVCLLGLALPAGISISGCTRNPDANYCNGLGYGPKVTAVASITLQPQIGGISMAYGQTLQIQSPSAYTCRFDPASISTAVTEYGTTNNQLVDISPGGQLCAGTWNRNTGGGIADYTNCNYPNPLPSTGGLPYAVAYITATAYSVTSNPVAVYIHAPVTAINLVTSSLSSTSSQQCFSQNQVAVLDAQACYVAPNSSGVPTQYEFCAPSSVTSYQCTGGLAPGVTSVPSCGSSIGTLNFSVSNSSVATISPASLSPATVTNPQTTITALQPGTTSITATIAQSASSAGYFSTCPAASVNVSLAGGGTKGIVTQGVTQNLTTTVLDTLGNPISGLNLSYESTNPIDIGVSGGGAITAAFPGVASIYAVCEPASCNPAPINEFGLNGTGLSLTSNPVGITVPGTTSDFVWFGAPGQSQYFASIELLTGNPGSTVRLPYVPNSMVMDQGGNSLYFGSARELMVYSTASNSLTAQNTAAPGVVLAVSPNNSELVVNDQVRGLFYLYNTSSGPTSSFGGMGVAAAWTPDSNTLYIVDNAQANTPGNCPTQPITGHTNTLYVYNVNVGWSTYPLPPNPLPAGALPSCTAQPDAPISTNVQALAITVPAIGAYIAGNPTVAHTWCPGGTGGPSGNQGTVGNNASILFYPQSDSVGQLTNVLGATSDGAHMLGASIPLGAPPSGSSITLDDIGLSIPPNSTHTSALCPETTTGTPPNQVETMTPLSTNPMLDGTVNLTGVTNATAVNQVVIGTAPTTASTSTAAPIAFVTYATPSTSNTAVQLPYYLPQASGAGPVGYVKFADNSSTTPPTAPLTGTFSPDNSTFFVSTAGDNEIHFISIPTNVNNTSAPPTDSQQYSPALPACTPLPPISNGNDAGCLYPAAPGANTVVPATVITVKPRSIT
jgi:trimeric autotransporter adhesin